MMWNRNIMLFLCAYVYVHACAEPLLPSQTLRHCGLQPARPLCPWDSPGKNTAVGCRASTRDLPDPGDYQNLENKMEKMQESINKDLEELKNKHTPPCLLISAHH